MDDNLNQTMVLIRRVEERIIAEYEYQKIRCPVHLCIGQEAIAAGVCAALKPEDSIFPSYRSHGWYLAKGGDLDAMIAELYGQPEGCAHGRGGSMHLIDRAAGVMGSSAIVGGMLPIAVGMAFAKQLSGEPGIVVVPFGDGAVEEGVFHETMNFAALRKPPLLFICENNQLAVNTPIRDRQPPVSIWERATSYGVPSITTDGTDVERVYRSAFEAVKFIREGKGPMLVEYLTNRARVHCGPEPEADQWNDPLDSVQIEEEDITRRIDKAFERWA